MATLSRVVLTLAASTVGSYIIATNMWKKLETLARRSEDAYNQTMNTLQQNFERYAKEILPKERKLNVPKNIKWSDREPKFTVPNCPHQLKHDPNREYFDTAGWLNPLECDLKEKRCVDERQEIQETRNLFDAEQKSLTHIFGHEGKWLLVALITGIATAVFSTFLILPAGSSSITKVALIISGGLLGATVAGCRTVYQSEHGFSD